MGDCFSGLGLVFCDRKNVVPHTRIYYERTFEICEDPISTILDRSHKDHDHHDGFHILDLNWTPIGLSTFLAPPLPRQPIPNLTNRGSRWLAALLTSRSANVLACLTIGQKGKFATLFVNGRAEDICCQTEYVEFLPQMQNNAADREVLHFVTSDECRGTHQPPQVK